MRQLSLYEAFSIERSQRAVARTVDTVTTWCYVCHDLTTETCRCACRATVHADCLLKCVRTTGRPYCTICLGPIANLKVRRWRRISRRISLALVVTGAAVCYSSVFAAVMVGMYVEANDSDVAIKCAIQGIGSLMQAWAASKLFSWLVEKRDLTAEHVEYEYG
jgi:hypothetical protein